MALHGTSKIDIAALKRWANSLDINKIEKMDIGGAIIDLDGTTRKILDQQRNLFVTMINNLKTGDDWRICRSAISPMFDNAFIRIDNSSLRFADFYECLIIPSNMKTYKKIIKGFDDFEVGEINIYNNDKVIASIGVKSDLMWSVFYDYFINENEDGSLDHVYKNHEQIMSIQLFDVENKTLEQLVALTNEILLCVSMEYDMDFKIYKLNHISKQVGDNPVYNMDFAPKGYEQIPMLYFNNALNAQDERLAYLSYYQVIEYFFIRAQNNFFLNKLAEIDLENIDHNELRKILTKYKKVSNERDTLKLIFSNSVDITKFKDWINSSPEYQQKYCHSEKLAIDISMNDENILSKLVERVYSYRCSIAHAKGDVDEYIAIPFISNQIIANELPLLKYLAFEVINKFSQDNI